MKYVRLVLKELTEFSDARKRKKKRKCQGKTIHCLEFKKIVNPLQLCES